MGRKKKTNQPVGLGLPRVAGQYRPRGCPFLFPGCCYRFTEGFMIRGSDLIVPRCGETSPLSRGETLAVRWLHDPQTITNHPVGLGFHYSRARYWVETRVGYEYGYIVLQKSGCILMLDTSHHVHGYVCIMVSWIYSDINVEYASYSNIHFRVYFVFRD